MLSWVVASYYSVCCGLGRTLIIAFSGLTLGQRNFQDDEEVDCFPKMSWVVSIRFVVNNETAFCAVFTSIS